MAKIGFHLALELCVDNNNNNLKKNNNNNNNDNNNNNVNTIVIEGCRC